MKKWWLLLLFLCCWIAVGFALGSIKTSNEADSPPDTQSERIVSMAPNLTEILFALGLDDEIVAVTSYSDYPPQALEKTKVGTFWQPNIEAIVAAKPNLVITLDFEQQQNLATRLNRMDYRTLSLNIETVGDFYDATNKIAAATSSEDKAEELLRGIRSKLDALSNLIADKTKVKVLWIVQREPLRVAGRDTFINEMIEMAGGENAIGRTIYQYPPISSEQVIACNPDVIIEPAMSGGNLQEQQDSAIEYWSKFENISAVVNKRIYVIEPDTVSRLGPRLYDGVETIAECLWPELFPEPEQ